MNSLKLGLSAGGLLLAAACDYTGDFLFAGPVEGVPAVAHLGEIQPVDVNNSGDVEANTYYGEVGPTGTAEQGGVTFTFEGTGGHVCVWIDPEIVFWSQSVAARRPTEKWSYPDNVFDDGDLDLFAGLAAYYTGSPGEKAGDFKVRYEDSLGQTVEVELNECHITGLFDDAAHSGRGAPEYCTLFNTQPGVNYLVLMKTWSTPLDDDRLGYGVIVANGTCQDLKREVFANSIEQEECLIVGEAIRAGSDGAPGPWIGLNEVPSLPGSRDFEDTFCSGSRMSDFCRTEAETRDCDTQPCFCGDPANTPTAGSL